MQASALSVDSLLCAALRGEQPSWPWAQDDGPAATAVLERAGYHGVGPLLHHAPTPADWPSDVTQAWRRQGIQLTTWELCHQPILAGTIRALRREGVTPIVFKGSALAEWLYSDPVRTRGDTDLLVALEHKDCAHAVLLSLGWQRTPGVRGQFVSYQANYVQQTRDGAKHALDLHWKINNSEILSRLFSHDELGRGARPLPALDPGAIAPSAVHSLLIACMHRATHRTNPYYVDGVAHHTDGRLIWLYDIHLLAGQFAALEWSAFVALAREKGLCSVSLDALNRTRECFHTEVPESVVGSLGHRGATELPQAYLVANKWRQQWMDFRALAGMSQQAGLLGEMFFPPPDYMRAKFNAARAPLPWLYLRRAVGGVAKSWRRDH